MPIWAIVPVKPFSSAKSRLTGVLPAPERARLSRDLLEHVLTVLGRAPAVARTLVVSRDTQALGLARDLGAATVTESSAVDLNRALRRATEAARAQGASAVLIVPADLPWLSFRDIQSMAALGAADRTVIIAPDRHNIGTNALFVRPPGLLKYSFGMDSFRRHAVQAEQAGAQVLLYRQPGTALDVDLPEDLERYRAGAPEHTP